MNKWPLKMWLWPEQEIAYGYPADPRTIPVFVYPVIVTEAGQEAVAWRFVYEDGAVSSWRHMAEHDEGLHMAYLDTTGSLEYAYAAPPATIRQEERERCAKLAEQHFIPGHSVAGPHFAAQLAAAIRALTDEEKEG